MTERQIINPKDKNEFTQCQNCKVKLVGRKIGKSVKDYGQFTHRSKLVPLHMDIESEMVSHWQCPFCGYAFPRFS